MFLTVRIGTKTRYGVANAHEILGLKFNSPDLASYKSKMADSSQNLLTTAFHTKYYGVPLLFKISLPKMHILKEKNPEKLRMGWILPKKGEHNKNVGEVVICYKDYL